MYNLEILRDIHGLMRGVLQIKIIKKILKFKPFLLHVTMGFENQVTKVFFEKQNVYVFFINLNL